MADKHVSMAVVFDVPEGEEFRSSFPDMYERVKTGNADCLYYGFATSGNRVLCREGYTNGKAVLAHMKDVKETFEGVVAKVGKERIKIMVMGAQEDLDIISPHLSPFGPRMIVLDSGAMWVQAAPKGAEDTHVTILPEFTVPEGRMDEFKAGFPKFYEATKNGAGAAGLFYYGFGVGGNSVLVREGYKNAETAALHGADVKEMAEEPLKVCGPGGVKINVVGPKAEIDKLRPKLEPRGAIFWELDSGALWK